MQRIVAIVVTYNRKAMLLSCLRRLSSQQGAACDVMSIDNASSDGTREAVKPWLGENVLYFNTGSNIGGAGGFNYGMKRAMERGYSHLWLMDDDTLPNPDALCKLMEADALLQGRYGFLSSAALWTDGTPCRMNRQKIRKSVSAPVGLTSVTQATFVSLLVPAQTVEEYGFPIREFFIWGDDIEYTRRIAVRGGSAGYLVPDSRVTHAMQSNSGSNLARDDACRIPRYRYAYRNECFTYRQEGVRGTLYYMIKCCYHGIRILLVSRDQKLSRLKTLLSSVKEGMGFNPVIEGISTEEACSKR